MWKEFGANLKALLTRRRPTAELTECARLSCRRLLREQEGLAFEGEPGRFCGLECFMYRFDDPLVVDTSE